MSTPAVLWWVRAASTRVAPSHVFGLVLSAQHCSTEDEAPEVLPHPWLDLVHEVGLLTMGWVTA